MNILGIDPGSTHLGVGCIKKNGNLLELVFASTVNAPQKKPLYDRLQILSEKLRLVLDRCQPEVVAIEDLFHGQNARSAFHLGLARGVVVAACLDRRLKIFEYAPTQVKSVVTGYGRADKEQVRKMISLLLGQQVNEGLDASDALAVAICHASQSAILTGLA
ncbi:MAG: crossover junction endodeoxyribonuclease RuvC [Deltaproteobacteria bacterium]|nr:crossover junction endodeoxyribonuclease RuvC [Deltaproteobacteria bacterium]